MGGYSPKNTFAIDMLLLASTHYIVEDVTRIHYRNEFGFEHLFNYHKKTGDHYTPWSEMSFAVISDALVEAIDLFLGICDVRTQKEARAKLLSAAYSSGHSANNSLFLNRCLEVLTSLPVSHSIASANSGDPNVPGLKIVSLS